MKASLGNFNFASRDGKKWNLSFIDDKGQFKLVIYPVVPYIEKAARLFTNNNLFIFELLLESIFLFAMF